VVPGNTQAHVPRNILDERDAIVRRCVPQWRGVLQVLYVCKDRWASASVI
jgi:hypothetical protein